MTRPLACDPSSLPKYPPSKEYDAKRQGEEERRFPPNLIFLSLEESTIFFFLNNPLSLSLSKTSPRVAEGKDGKQEASRALPPAIENPDPVVRAIKIHSLFHLHLGESEKKKIYYSLFYLSNRAGVIP